MLAKILICMLLMLHPLSAVMTEQDLIDKYDNYCGGVDFRDVESFEDKLEDYREDRDNEYYNDSKLVVQDLSQARRRKIIDLTIAPFILLIIYGSVVALILIGYLLSCFDVIKIEKRKFCLTIAIVLLLMILTLFIIGATFVAASARKRQESLCYFYKIQVNALLGGTEDHAVEGFIGFRPMSIIATQFAAEIGSIEDNQSLYQPLIDADFVGTTSTTYQKLLNFVNVNQNKTPNSTGSESVPISNQLLNPTVNGAIESEFSFLSLVGSRLTQMAEISQNFQNNVYSNQMVMLLRNLAFSFQQSDLLLTGLLLGDGHVTKFDGHLQKGGRTAFYSVIPLMILFLAAIILGFMKKTRRAGHFVMIIACLVLIVIALGFIFWVFGAAEISGVCGILREINTGNTEIITNLGGNVALKSFADSCIVENGKNDFVTKTMPNQSALNLYNDFVAYLDALTLYNFFMTTPDNSVAIPLQKSQWEQIVQGLQVDHVQAQANLEKFNDAISCNGENFGFTTQSCSGSDCKSILDTASYSSPSCVSDQAAINAQFVNLKNYIEGAVQNAKKLQREIGKINEDQTPNGAYTSSKEFMKSYQPNIQQIQDLHVNSLQAVHKNDTFEEYLNCSVFRKDFLRLEYVGCYKFAYWSYSAIIVWSILVILAFLFLLTMFWALGQTEEEEEEEEEYTPEPQKFYTNQADDINVDDNEKIPMA